MDYLLKGSEDNIEDIKIANKPFAERIKLLNALNEKEQEVITEVIDAMLTRKKILDFITSKEAIIGK